MNIGKHEVSITDADGNVMKGIASPSDIVRSGYAGIEEGELSFSAEVVDMGAQKFLWSLCGLTAEWESLSKVLERTIKSWDECILLCRRIRGKQRKTTYKTIRRDCAKRNRHK